MYTEYQHICSSRLELNIQTPILHAEDIASAAIAGEIHYH